MSRTYADYSAQETVMHASNHIVFLEHENSVLKCQAELQSNMIAYMLVKVSPNVREDAIHVRHRKLDVFHPINHARGEDAFGKL